MRNKPLPGLYSPLKQKPKKKLGIKAQGFSNVQVPGVNWAKGIKELKHISPSRQGVNVSGINLSKDFKLGKNLKLNISNPAAVYVKPTIDGIPGKGKFKALPFEPRVGLTYTIPRRKRK